MKLSNCITNRDDIFLRPLFPSLLLRWLISVLSSPVSWPLQPEWMPLSARPSNPQTAAPLLPLSCHALLMSLSLTQLLLHRLDVINLLKVECQPAITCLHLCYSTLAVYSDSPLSHLWYTFFSLISSFSRHISPLSPSLSVTPARFSLAVLRGGSTSACIFHAPLACPPRAARGTNRAETSAETAKEHEMMERVRG